MACRCFTLLGAQDLWIKLDWLQGSTWNGMKWGALTLLETTHSRGCYLKFAVLLVQSVCSPRRPKTKDPGSCPLEAYIAGDTLHHQPYTTEGAKWSSPPFKLSVVYYHILSPYSATILRQLYHIMTTPIRQPPPNGSPGEEVRTIVKSTVKNQKSC